MITNNKLSFEKDNIKTKDQALKEISKIMSNNFSLDGEYVYDLLLKREDEFSTGLGDGVSIPHASVEGIDKVYIVFLRYKNEIDWKSIDGKNVKFSIAIFAPINGRDEHFKVLTEISKKLTSKENIDYLKNQPLDKVIDFLNKVTISDEENVTKDDKNQSYDIVGVTSCPTGIAHTYMAAEALRKAGEELGLKVKIETQGQHTDNQLSKEDIDNASGIIIAIDRDIDKARFNDKYVIESKTKDAIKNPKELIEKSLSKNVEDKTLIKSIGKANTTNELESGMTFDNFSKRLWKSLMTGVSYMLPFVVFGGIMISLSFLIDISNAGNSNYGSGNQVAYWFNGIGGLSMQMIVPMLTAYIMFALIGKQGILPGIVLGFIAAGAGPIWLDFITVNTSWLPDAAFTDSTRETLYSVSSGFIGGILFAFVSSIIFIWLSKQFDKILPQSMNGIKLILLLPLIGTLTSVGILWFVNIPLTYVTWSLLYVLDLLNEPYLIWLMGLILGGMMAVDMGGPVNKTAYLFGVAMASSGASVEMAAVMAAGMTPPLGIALATSFKRGKLWDQEDINAGYTNWALGASFVTEGAIPFATKYPKVVMPSIILGSATTGLLSALLGAQTLAPHGGIFTIALLTNKWVGDGIGGLSIAMGIITWLVAIGIGTIVTAVSLLYLRNKEVNSQQV